MPYWLRAFCILICVVSSWVLFFAELPGSDADQVLLVIALDIVAMILFLEAYHVLKSQVVEPIDWRQQLSSRHQSELTVVACSLGVEDSSLLLTPAVELLAAAVAGFDRERNHSRSLSLAFVRTVPGELPGTSKREIEEIVHVPRLELLVHQAIERGREAKKEGGVVVPFRSRLRLAQPNDLPLDGVIVYDLAQERRKRRVTDKEKS